MDIATDKRLEYDELKLFLARTFPALNFFLIYEGVTDWDDVNGKVAVVQYSEDDSLAQGFKYLLSVYAEGDDMLPLIENLSFRLSGDFNCAVVCDASRIVLKAQNYFYSLLFEAGKVFLVDDDDCENTGCVTKIVELHYHCPGSQPDA